MATSAPLAAAAAAAGSVPGSYFTVALRCARLDRLQRRGREPDLLLPMRRALSGRHNGVAADRIDLRRTAAGDHAHIGVRADDRDGVQPCCASAAARALFILEQHDAAFFDLARSLESGKRIDDAALARIIDHARGKHRAQNAMHMLIQFGLRNLSRLHRCLVARRS